MAVTPKKVPGSPARPWTILSNHGHVLVCIALDPDARIREIAARTGLTQQTTHALIADLVDGGVIERIRIGRRNRYVIDSARSLDDRVDAGTTVGELLGSVGAWPVQPVAHPAAPVAD